MMIHIGKKCIIIYTNSITKKAIITEEQDANLDFKSLLTENEKNVVDYVLKHFAIYNGTVLQEFTHNERP